MKLSKVFLWIVIVPILVVAVLCLRQIVVIALGVKGVSYRQIPFNRSLSKPDLKFLFLGDSTAVGTGAVDNMHTTAGYFGQDFPSAEIVNISHNGQKIHELLRSFEGLALGQYDLLVIQIGANDILKVTPFGNIEQDLGALIERAKTVSRHVVILHSGNVGVAPMFRWPFDLIMTERSRRVRDIYMRQAKAHGVLYVDLFAEREDDLFLKDVPRYYSADRLHPSGDGYRWWYDRIRQTLDEAGVMLQEGAAYGAH